MIDRPAELSPDEIMTISRDEELRELYEISAKLQDTLQPDSLTPVTQEWDMFSRKLNMRRPKKKLYRRLALTVAVVAGVLLISAAVVKIIGHAPSVPDSSLTAGVVKNVIIENPADTTACRPLTPRRPMDVAEEHISRNSGSPRQTTAKGTPHDLSAAASIDIDNYMRIEQARIDNEIAMAMAEIYDGECNARIDVVADIAECSELYDDVMVSAAAITTDIDKVIML